MSQFYKFEPHPRACQIKILPQLYSKYFGEIANGAFVEVGAFDGESWSNTLPLADMGWRGVMCEPNPEMAERCTERHSDNDVKVLPFAIGSIACVAKLYINDGWESIATTSKRWATKKPVLLEDKFIECPMITLNMALSSESVPRNFELLVIDTEGTEPDVLEGFDIDYWRPVMCIVECHEKMDDPLLSENAESINEYFSNHGYRKIHSDHINNIYVYEQTKTNR